MSPTNTVIIINGSLLLASVRVRWIEGVWRGLRHRAEGPWSAGVAVAGVTLVTSVLVTWAFHFPPPNYHDEFSYLLAADTFAHGRLANPPHPHWQHFESFHLIQQPTYASKYPPGQGALLALGLVLFGDPLITVWLGMALAATATCWMFRAWLPDRWALIGGIVLALHFHVLYLWAPGYWGGQLAMAGSALVYGAAFRILRGRGFATFGGRIAVGGGRREETLDTIPVGSHQDALPAGSRLNENRHAAMLWCALALGLVILANTRPFEGVVVSLPVVLVLTVWLIRLPRESRMLTVKHGISPACVILAAATTGMLFYNKSVTGSALKMPYRLHEETYSIRPLFPWGALNEGLTFRHDALRRYQVDYELAEHHRQATPASRMHAKLEQYRELGRFFLNGYSLTFVVPLLVSPFLFRRRGMPLVLFALSLALVVELLILWIWPHYLAPASPLFLLTIVQGLRTLHGCRWRGWRVGQVVARALLLIHVATFGNQLWTNWTTNFDFREPIYHERLWPWHRDRILAELEELGGRHLVFVRYSPNHDCHDEWVFNAADIDSAPIVWARERDPVQNRELLADFRDRHVWVVLADAAPPTKLPYNQRPLARQENELAAAVTNDPNNAVAEYRLGVLLQQTGRLTDGVNRLRHAVALDPALLDARVALGQALFELSLDARLEGINALEQAASIAPRNIKVLLALAALYDQYGDRQTATMTYLSVLQIDPNNPTAKPHVPTMP